MIIETVVCSVQDALAAERCGVNRIELCSAIEVGGLTPSIGLVREVRSQCRLPQVVMVRPRPGGFVYSGQELATMRRDIEALVETGIDGVVLGVLNADGTIDVRACERLLDGVRIAKVFHRAFDLTPEPHAALDGTIEAGFTRVLTSGHSESALEGAAAIRDLIGHADGRIEILAGGGIRPANVVAMCRMSKVSQFHLGPFLSDEEPSPPQFGVQRRLDEETLSSVVEIGRTLV